MKHMPLTAYDITSPGIIHCGAGELERVAEDTARLGTRAVILTGSHLHESDLVNGLMDELGGAGVESFVAPQVTSEPTVDLVDDIALFIKQHDADIIISIGGGSVMDAAKAAALMARNDGTTEDYQLKARSISNPPIPHIAVPTTAGTGSEATRVSVLTNERIGVKRSISHQMMTPGVAVLDPQLTVSCSAYLTTATAMDAFAHAIESAVSTNATPYTKNIGLAGVEQISAGLPLCQQNLEDLDGRLACLLGSCFAGLSMQAGLGASHSLAPAVCTVAGIRHSEAVAALMPHVIRLNERAVPGVYDEVKRVMNVQDPADRIEEFCRTGGVPTGLASYGLSASDWDEVLEVMNRYASHRQTNPIEVTDERARELFEVSAAQ